MQPGKKLIDANLANSNLQVRTPDRITRKSILFLWWIQKFIFWHNSFEKSVRKSIDMLKIIDVSRINGIKTKIYKERTDDVPYIGMTTSTFHLNL